MKVYVVYEPDWTLTETKGVYAEQADAEGWIAAQPRPQDFYWDAHEVIAAVVSPEQQEGQ